MIISREMHTYGMANKVDLAIYLAVWIECSMIRACPFVCICVRLKVRGGDGSRCGFLAFYHFHLFSVLPGLSGFLAYTPAVQ